MNSSTVNRLRVRIWQPVEERRASDAPIGDAAAQATRGNPLRAATIETEDGEGPVLVLALGGGDRFITSHAEEPYEPATCLLRVWEVEEAFEAAAAADMPDWLLSETHDALCESGAGGIRLLTAEENAPDGSPYVVAASWYDGRDHESAADDST